MSMKMSAASCCSQCSGVLDSIVHYVQYKLRIFKEPPPKTLELRYFDIPGKGAPIRQVAAYIGAEFTDHRYKTREEFLVEDKPKLKFGQVPLLKAGFGPINIDMVQTTAIMRYLARAYGRKDLYPDGARGQIVDSLCDFEVDFALGESAIKYGERNGIILDEEATKKSIDAYVQVIKQKLELLDKCIANKPPMSEKDSPWLAGTKLPTIADFLWGCRLRGTASSLNTWGKSSEVDLSKFPNVKRFFDAYSSIPIVKKWSN
ncbi:glutathione S-transferase [Pseudoscourfieldia marina]